LFSETRKSSTFNFFSEIKKKINLGFWRKDMKIAVSSQGGSMDALVSEQFGRCAYFIIVDTETMKFEPISNDTTSMTGGVGPAAVKKIAQRGVKKVLTGKVGPNAETALKASGIEIVTGISGTTTVRQAVENYLKTK